MTVNVAVMPRSTWNGTSQTVLYGPAGSPTVQVSVCPGRGARRALTLDVEVVHLVARVRDHERQALRDRRSARISKRIVAHVTLTVVGRVTDRAGRAAASVVVVVVVVVVGGG